MPIDVTPGWMPIRSKLKSGEWAERIGIAGQNPSPLHSGKVNAVRFEPGAAICHALERQPGDPSNSLPVRER